MCRLVATAVETVAVARFALCAVLAVVIELAVCLRLMFGDATLIVAHVKVLLEVQARVCSW